MRVLHAIRTPWAPYSLMFANDGTRLAVGGGAWYGEGGISLARLDSGEVAVTPMGPQRGYGPPSVAGVYFSADDRYLVAVTRGSSLGPGPTILFAVDGLSIGRAAAFEPAGQRRMGDPCATGAMMAGESTIVRHWASSVEQCIAVRRFSPRFACRADDRRHHLTHSRVVVRRGRALTGGGGSLALAEWRADSGLRESGRAAEGLISAPLAGEGPCETIPIEGCPRVTAIAALPGEDGFLTGGLRGELDRWSWAETLRQERLAVPGAPLANIEPALPTTPKVQEAVAALAWATYTRDSVVAICTLHDETRWVSVDAGGRLRLWQGAQQLGAWTLPAPGTPRSLAAHPSEPWIAVGIKQGGFGHPSSLVLVLEL
ncbi:hypothetical protein [Nannocystis bainbridge]|uniref:WD40 repeat domain-containing protein n=1 Tax=Nannocystis bainbridge TaxID=2995303 RepID=A0ABT5DZW5_9BACT|nr:hypothetical protein [Nannocystis bainbridge]MDC0719159.1 hypothetical protein [Nannocystis bainbridge]